MKTMWFPILFVLAISFDGVGCDTTSNGTPSDANSSELPTENDSGDPAVDLLTGDEIEFAAYCQGIVDAFRALYEGLEIPERILWKGEGKNGEEFDPNVFFTVLDRLQMADGWVLDFTYWANDLGGEPTLVARRADTPKCGVVGEQSCVKEDFRGHVLVDGTREGWFQLMVLFQMGQNFYRFWHAGSGRLILPSEVGIEAWIDDQFPGWDKGEQYDQLKADMATIDVHPLVVDHGDLMEISFIVFSFGGGVLRSHGSWAKTPPYNVVSMAEDNGYLLECYWCPIP